MSKNNDGGVNNLHITHLLFKIKQLLPYLVLIATYFFFINIEAKRIDLKNEVKSVDESLDVNHNYLVDNELNSVIKLPVIQYKK